MTVLNSIRSLLPPVLPFHFLRGKATSYIPEQFTGRLYSCIARVLLVPLWFFKRLAVDVFQTLAMELQVLAI
ncbi:MAG: hypothetical protein JO108_21295 [Acidobacteriaceae bacterium]|nr:hypothetical protein [Acidobacteriaceae bacterium]